MTAAGAADVHAPPRRANASALQIAVITYSGVIPAMQGWGWLISLFLLQCQAHLKQRWSSTVTQYSVRHCGLGSKYP